MSAFIVFPAHIDVMLSTAINGPKDSHRPPGSSWYAPYVDEILEGSASGPLTAATADRVGQALLAECVASVFCYYNGPPAKAPGQLPDPDPGQYEWTNYGPILTAIECCKAIGCYEYQSCEHPGWRDSGSRAFCEHLRGSLIRCMEGFEKAPREWSTELVLARSQVRSLLGT